MTPPLPERGTYGEPWLPNLYETEHFAVTWADGSGSEAAAQSAAQAMEDAWSALVDEQGWEPPVSADDYLLWVILDDSLGGTGVTPEYATDEYPQGYPVIYLNPTYAGYTEFWTHLSAHEFAHALQYAPRDDYSSAGAEAWYWEASAEWQVEQALPEVDDYARQTEYYATAADARYDSTQGWHQYGMVALNAWLDEQWGEDGLRAVWAASGGGADWLELIEAESGLQRQWLWAGFTADYGAETLRESHLYWDAETQGPLQDGSEGSLPLLGTHYYEARSETAVRATGEVVLGAPWGVGEVVNVQPGDLLAVTGLQDGADYSLAFEALIEPPDTGDDIVGDSDSDSGSEEGPGGCGCTSSAPGPGALALLALLSASCLCRRRGCAARTRAS